MRRSCHAIASQLSCMNHVPSVIVRRVAARK